MDALNKERVGAYDDAVQGKVAGTDRPADAGTIAEQARALLKGKNAWQPTWQDFGEPVEVEQKMPLSRPTDDATTS
jgi:hypothetical protein